MLISHTKQPKLDFGVFAKGYHRAANLLAKEFLNQASVRDYDGYPIIFLYRHAFELNLKNIIYWSVRLSEFKEMYLLDEKLSKTHNLETLSTECKKLLKALFLQDESLHNIAQQIGKTAHEYSQIDKNSFSFRYPIDNDGNYSTSKNLRVNITFLHKHMDNILSEMEAINFGLDIETDHIKDVLDILSNYTLN